MKFFGTDIKSLYFDYTSPVWHEPGCSHAIGGQLDVGLYRYEGREIQEFTLRLMCPGCGAVTFVSMNGEPDMERTDTSAIGFGLKPEKVAGLWLHPGPPLWRGEEHGPTKFYVTRTKDRPRAPEDVDGIVGWSPGRRGGIHWQAELAAVKYDMVVAKETADRDFKSRPAAVKWIAAHLEGDSEVTP